MTSKWNHEDIKLHLEEFYNVYSNRPIKDNSGGMKSPHMFPAWYVLKKIQPKCNRNRHETHKFHENSLVHPWWKSFLRQHIFILY